MYSNKKNKIFSVVLIGVLVLGVVSTGLLLKNPISFFSKAFEKNVIFTIAPESATVKSDQDFNVSVLMNPNGNVVSSVELVMEYDPTILNIGVDNVELGSMLPVQLGQASIVNVDPTHNLFKISLISNCTNSGCTPAKSEGNLVTVTFKGLANSDGSSLSLSHQTKAYSVYETTASPTALTYIANKVVLGVRSASSGLTSTADVYVNEASPALNYANEASLVASNTGTNSKKIAYLKFDLTNQNGIIKKAQLRLVPRVAGDISKTIHIVSNTSWDEQTLTWDSKPSEGNVVGSYTGSVTEGSPLVIDLDASYLSSYPGKVLSIQVGDLSQDASTFDFFSKEAVGKGPALLLEMEPQVSTYALSDISDTYVQSLAARADKNYSTQEVLVSSSYEATNLHVSYLKFGNPQIAGKKIKSAKLTLVPTLARKVDKVVRTVSGDWNETAVTYNSKPTLGTILGTITSGDSALAINTPITISLDPTNLTISANGEISLAIDNTGNANTLSVYSKEYGNASMRPVLTVETY